jgi:uncharacterized SAM-binding protein YcdF (DUF218 family)
MNDLLVSGGVVSWKPVLEALLMPPVPLLLLVLIGARLMFRRRLLAWLLILAGVVGIWLMCTTAAGIWMTRILLTPPHALGSSDIAELKRQPKTAIVVLGAGRRPLAPEYGLSTLKPLTLERLRFGLWLARETGLPVAFSGGVGHGAEPGPSEAEIAARIAEREFGRALRWTEGQSRDTTENGIRSVALLQGEGIEHIVLVTHAFHMRRALGAFERALQRSNARMTLVAAPLGADTGGRVVATDWLPSTEGFQMTRIALHEWIGRLAGA